MKQKQKSSQYKLQNKQQPKWGNSRKLPLNEEKESAPFKKSPFLGLALQFMQRENFGTKHKSNKSIPIYDPSMHDDFINTKTPHLHEVTALFPLP